MLFPCKCKCRFSFEFEFKFRTSDWAANSYSGSCSHLTLRIVISQTAASVFIKGTTACQAKFQSHTQLIQRHAPRQIRTHSTQITCTPQASIFRPVETVAPSNLVPNAKAAKTLRPIIRQTLSRAYLDDVSKTYQSHKIKQGGRHMVQYGENRGRKPAYVWSQEVQRTAWSLKLQTVASAAWQTSQRCTIELGRRIGGKQRKIIGHGDHSRPISRDKILSSHDLSRELAV